MKSGIKREYKKRITRKYEEWDKAGIIENYALGVLYQVYNGIIKFREGTYVLKCTLCSY